MSVFAFASNKMGSWQQMMGVWRQRSKKNANAIVKCEQGFRCESTFNSSEHPLATNFKDSSRRCNSFEHLLQLELTHLPHPHQPYMGISYRKCTRFKQNPTNSCKFTCPYMGGGGGGLIAVGCFNVVHWRQLGNSHKIMMRVITETVLSWKVLNKTSLIWKVQLFPLTTSIQI